MPEPETFETLRPLLFSIAYRMLASVAEAEDVVQEAFLRYEHARRGETRIDSPKAWLSAVVTRLSIDELRSARARRETYSGEWLPEPLPTDDHVEPGDPGANVEEAESLAMAFLLVLDRLSPVERAVFLLHDVFAYDYWEIAAIVGKSEVNCRQIGSRARRQVQSGKPRFEASRRERTDLASRFFAAMTNGDMDGLVELLAADVVVHGDGGGKAPQWARAIAGVDRVGPLLIGLGRQMRELGIRLEPRPINGQPGAVLHDAEGRITNVLSLDIYDGAVQTIRSVINPDKLRHLGPVSDVRALAHELRPRRQTSAEAAKSTLRDVT